MSHTFRYAGPFTEEEGRASVARQKAEPFDAFAIEPDGNDCNICGYENHKHHYTCPDFDSGNAASEYAE